MMMMMMGGVMMVVVTIRRFSDAKCERVDRVIRIRIVDSASC